MAHRFPFTSAVLDSLIPPRVGFEVVRDSYNPELQLYITANGAKTFFVRKRFRGKDVRKILGKYPDIDIDDARDAADDAVKKMHEPIPVRSGSISLKKMADNFLKNKVKRAPDSMRKLERQIARLLADILPLKLSEITPDTLSGAHLKIAMTNGKSTANRLKETISAIFNMAIEEGYVKTNPARGLEKFPEKKGARFISPGEFLALGNAIEEEKNATMRAAM
ncbi:MAG: integrase arm-type DNA-binding domain-containing protein, partial [Rickettsiales bacterium]|nr:integrase arm-type DNA-binding domain-containing protein [Rickettsiales bacterium]